MKAAMITVGEAAKRLAISRRRVLALIQMGRLPAERFGNTYALKEADLALVAERTPGRPRKEGKVKE
jgi:excisionase family DNA binding protein